MSIDIVDSPPYRQRDQDSAFAWSTARFQHIMRLKEEAIRVARKMWADYIFVSNGVMPSMDKVSSNQW